MLPKSRISEGKPKTRNYAAQRACHLIANLLLPSGQQYELLDWLDNVTFPMEAQYADPDFARKVYNVVVRKIIDSGVRIIA